MFPGQMSKGSGTQKSEASEKNVIRIIKRKYKLILKAFEKNLESVMTQEWLQNNVIYST